MTVHKQNLPSLPPDSHPRSYACIVCICPAVSLIPPALLLCPPAQEQVWEKMNGDVWAEEARTRVKNKRMTERGKAVLEWLWDKWGSERGQGQGWGKQSISLTHTLRDILRLWATLLSTLSLGWKKSCACVSHSMRGWIVARQERCLFCFSESSQLWTIMQLMPSDREHFFFLHQIKTCIESEVWCKSRWHGWKIRASHERGCAVNYWSI